MSSAYSYRMCARCGGPRRCRYGVCPGCFSPVPEAEAIAEAPPLAEPVDLFAEPAEAPAQRHSPTSLAAAEKIQASLKAKRAEVALWFCETFARRNEGGTDNELIAAFITRGWSANTPRARRVELAADGWLEAGGQRDGSTLWCPTDKLVAWSDAQKRRAA